MTLSLRCIFVSALCFMAFVSSIHAEEKKSIKEYEEVIPMPKNDAVDIGSLKRAKLTEEQVVNQLKYMMVQGFARMEKDLVENNDFPPFGLTLFPDGEFKAVTIESEVEVPNEIALAAVAKNMEAIAQKRATWAVGIMYIRAIKRDDGSYAQRIIVMTEHIAGWARHWAYPFKIENGEVKLGKPTESPANPVYYVQK